MNRIITILVTIFILLLLYIWISHVWGSDNPRQPKEIVDATEDQLGNDPMDDTDTSVNTTLTEPLAQNQVSGDEFNTERRVSETIQDNSTPVTSAVPEKKKPEESKPEESKPAEKPKSYVSNTTVSAKEVATATKPAATPTKTVTKPAAKPATTSVSSAPSAGGKHLVIAGNFTQKINAQQRVDELKRAGFKNAEIVNFDLSEYNTVCVGRFSDVNEARKLVKKLKDYHHIDAYVRIGG